MENYYEDEDLEEEEEKVEKECIFYTDMRKYVDSLEEEEELLEDFEDEKYDILP